MRSWTTVPALLSLAAMTACAQSDANERVAAAAAPPRAVFERWADTTYIPADSGTNIRRFNVYSPIIGQGTDIVLGTDSATITLKTGTYRITGFSITTLGYGDTSSKVRSVPGYAFLAKIAGTDTTLALIGSMQDAQFSLASEIDGYVTVNGTSTYQLAHQNGMDIGGVYMQTGHKLDHGGGGHIFARLLIEKVPN